MKPALTRPRQLALGLLACAVLVMVFASYRRPDFMLDVANRIWLCF